MDYRPPEGFVKGPRKHDCKGATKADSRGGGGRIGCHFLCFLKFFKIFN